MTNPGPESLATYRMEEKPRGRFLEWRHAAAWTEGDPSRFGCPMDDATIIREAQAYLMRWPRRKIRVLKNETETLFQG